jgi:hypothetical protein
MSRVTKLESVVESAALVTPFKFVIVNELDGEQAGAVYSLDETHRYVLWRIWDITKPLWMWAMLNPSTATHFILDPTLTRCRIRAERAGAGGMIVGNAGAVRETDSSKAVRHADPIGEHNEFWLRLCIPLADKHIVGCGPLAKKFGGDKLFTRVFADAGVPLFALKRTADGSPGHPLYVGYDVEPFPYKFPIAA